MELKANELRIGNLLNTINGIKKVSNITIDGYCWFTDNQCEAIPLTEEWLIKFGKKADSNDSFGGFIIPLPNGNGLRIKDNKWNAQHSETKVDFVHQLQNLYFALTGKELTHQKIN